MVEDRETIIQRVINFLYDALDRFQDTVGELNASIASLMDGLKKAQGDLTGTGLQRATIDRSAVAAAITKGPQDSAGSREKLIALLSGKGIAPPRPAPAAPAAPPGAVGRPPIPASAAPRAPAMPPPSAMPPRPPAAGPPAAMPPRPPAAGPPAAMPPRPPAAGPPAAMPPRPPAAGPPAAAPAMAPPTLPMAGPPRPAVPAPTAGAAGPAGPVPAGGAPTISGLRDEMLKELKRLKSIMKGEK
jgi:hypothetical protein